MATKASKPTEIEIEAIHTGRIHFAVLGATPIILNSMNAKTMQTLLLPPKKKNTAERASTLKHDVMAEFQRAPYRLSDPKAPTLLAHLATAFKKAISGAAIDTPGASKAQIGRLCWVKGERLPIYGVPQLLMSNVRSADMSKTPDVRTRVILPEWAMFLDVTYVQPILTEKVVCNLLANAGLIQGTGDWRNEKGSGTHGQFELVKPDHPDFKRIIKDGGRKVQEKAMAYPECYDEETRELYAWYVEELKVRGRKTAAEDEAEEEEKAA